MMTPDTNEVLRSLPSVDALLHSPEMVSLLTMYPRSHVVEAIRATLEACRQQIQEGDGQFDAENIPDMIAQDLASRELDRLRPVVNATGIILHTGLGRAVLPGSAAEALAGLDRCCNIQVDLETGQRGKRNYMSEQLLCELTGAEAALVVNNNAAATLLILTSLCAGREVIVSRGQLVEIGGSFRLPDCIHQSGAVMVEVGTTNKTHLHDYARALADETAAVLRVNPSNYRVVGFSKDVPTSDLVSLKKDRELLVIDDLGCGALVDLAQFGLPHEPTVQESIAAGVDVVCFSGDKLIGGPQAGIICGKREPIQQIRKHPLTRMLRVGKLTDLALEQTLRLFLDPETLVEKNPTLRMLAVRPEALKRRAQRLKRRLDKAGCVLDLLVVEAESATGGGSLPATPIPTFALAVGSNEAPAEAIMRQLRLHEPPIIARVADGEVILDMRTLLEGEEDVILHALSRGFDR